MTDEQIKYMTERFLSWKLPEDFSPDAGITFKPTFNDHMDPPMRHNPIGTNLFNYTQAEAMVRHMLGFADELTDAEKVRIDAAWEQYKAAAPKMNGNAAQRSENPQAWDSWVGFCESNGHP